MINLRLSVFCFGVACRAALAVAMADEQRLPRHPTLAARVEVLLVYTSDALGAERDIAEWQRVLHATFDQPKNFPAAMRRIPLEVRTLRDPSRADVLQHFSARHHCHNKTLVFAFAGHGGVDRGGHFITLADGPLHRDDLRRAILRKTPRLAVLVTDCCANHLPGEVELPKAQVKWKVLRGLLGRHRGLVDLNAAELGESAWGDAGGGVFTRTLTHLFCEAPPNVGGVPGYEDGFVPWREFIRFVRTRTNENYKKFRKRKLQEGRLRPEDEGAIRKQVAQHPHVWSLPKWRFGARLHAVPGASGLRVTEVFPRSPAARAGLRAGDVVHKLNGMAISRELDYAAIIDALPGGSLTVQLADGRSIRVPLAW